MADAPMRDGWYELWDTDDVKTNPVLPDPGVRVLVLCECGDYWIAKCEIEKGEWRFVDDSETPDLHGASISCAKYWQPLTAPKAIETAVQIGKVTLSPRERLIKNIVNPPKDYPHVNSAFINTLSEEGSKVDVLRWVTKLWNENAYWRQQAHSAAVQVVHDEKVMLDALREVSHAAQQYPTRDGADRALRVAADLTSAIHGRE